MTCFLSCFSKLKLKLYLNRSLLYYLTTKMLVRLKICYAVCLIIATVLIPFGIVQMVIPNRWATIDYISPDDIVYYNSNSSSCSISIDNHEHRICYSLLIHNHCDLSCNGSFLIGIITLIPGCIGFLCFGLYAICVFKPPMEAAPRKPPVQHQPSIQILTIETDTTNIGLGRSSQNPLPIIVENPN